MDCIVAGGTFTRNESGGRKTYKRGDPIKVTREEFAAFPNKFKPVLTPRDESREAELEAKVQTLEGQVTNLTAERDELKKGADAKELNKLKADLSKAQGEATGHKVDLNRLQSENTSLKRQLEEAQKPPKEPELKTNPDESTKTSKGTAKEPAESK